MSCRFSTAMMSSCVALAFLLFLPGCQSQEDAGMDTGASNCPDLASPIDVGVSNPQDLAGNVVLKDAVFDQAIESGEIPPAAAQAGLTLVFDSVSGPDQSWLVATLAAPMGGPMSEISFLDDAGDVPVDQFDEQDSDSDGVFRVDTIRSTALNDDDDDDDGTSSVHELVLTMRGTQLTSLALTFPVDQITAHSGAVFTGKNQTICLRSATLESR